MSGMTQQTQLETTKISKDGTDEVWDEAGMRRSRNRQRLTIAVSRLAFAIAVVSFWEFAARNLIDPFWIGIPSEVVLILWDWFSTGFIIMHFNATMRAMILGFLIGAAVGIATGFLLGRVRWLSLLLDPFLTALYSVPRIALAPLFILWFGIGTTSKMLLAAVIVFFLSFRSTYAGVMAVDRELVDVVNVMGAGRWDRLLKVVFPSSLAWIFTGLKLSVPYALAGTVVAEFVAAGRGLGWLIRQASGVFATNRVFAGLIVLGAIGFTLNILLDTLEKRTSKWRMTELV